MSGSRTVVLDNEAVQALLDDRHRKHRRLLAHVQAVTTRNRRRAGSVRLVVPTAVRVEAGWDRRAPDAAVINQLHVHDAPLDTRAADHAVRARAALGMTDLTVADSHIAAVLAATPGPHTVITSDGGDLRRIAGQLDLRVNVVEV